MKQVFLCLVLTALASIGADWPMWRGDAMRSATTRQALPEGLKPAWTLRLPPLKSAWQEAVNQDRMPYDVCYEPIVVGHRLFVNSNENDSVAAYDTRTGEQLWRSYLDAPVRLPLAAAGERLFLVCDDGALHVLSQTDGKHLGEVRGGIDDRLVLGNGRLISPWCARGGPVVADGRVYFGAGIWPFMGTSVHAVDAETLRPFWTNDSAGSQFMRQPHGGSDSFGGVAPQGAFAIAGQQLLVPSGRSVPAMFGATTGELNYFHLDGSPGMEQGPAPDRKLEGGSHLTTNGTYRVSWRALATILYDSSTGGGYLAWTGKHVPVLTEDRLYLGGEKELLGFDLAKLEREAYEVEITDRKTGEKQMVTRYRWLLPPLWKVDVPSEDAMVLAGETLYVASGSHLRAVSVTGKPLPGQAWETSVPGRIMSLVAADNQLFAVTQQGGIHAFAVGGQGNEIDALPPKQPSLARQQEVAAIAKRLAVPQGWSVVFGANDPERLEAILATTPLQVAAFCSDQTAGDKLRRHFDGKGLYGTRLSVRTGTPELPPYFAALVVVEDAKTVAMDTVASVLRPYGGVAWFPGNASVPAASFPEPGFRTERLGSGSIVTRTGALPGAADWTHLYGDLSNKAKSDDQRVRLPLGLLWFGGNSHDDVLPRHAHGPTELVLGGRLFVQGTHMLSARDVYTGMVFWRREFDDLGTFGDYYDKSYDADPTNTTYNQIHIPGANARGTNMVAAKDAIYLIRKQECLVLDPATGKTTATFQLPPAEAGEEPPEWVYIGTTGPWLVAGAEFVRFSPAPTPPKPGEKAKEPGPFDSYDRTSCQRLFVLDRKTGKVQWQRAAEHGFRHNTICAGGDTLFCLDAVPPPVKDQYKRRGKPVPDGTLLALDLAQGTVRWQDQERAFGTWLSYSDKHQVLVQCGRASRDMLKGEPNDRMAAFEATSGKVVWDRKVPHGGPIMLHGDRIILPAPSGKGGALDLMTGQDFAPPHPITGKAEPWSYFRRYGCNSVIAAEHLLAFRSGAAGFCDLDSPAGTGNFGGFKSGCTTNLIAADGVLNAPDYTRTCTCSYQNQASLALVPMPDVEPWTANAIDYDAGTDQVRELGLNLGAPGDRRDDDGVLWFDCPSVGGPSPTLPVETSPAGDQLATFQMHPSRVEGELPWVASSGLVDVSSVRVRLRNLDPVQTITLRVSNGADDAEEANGKLYATSSDLELTRDGRNEQLVAIRLRDVPIEPTDEILSAHLRFTVKSPSEEPTKLRIRAEAADTALALKEGIAQRPSTTQAVEWSPAPWTKAEASGKEQTTPDLSGLVREVVGRPGWKPGNALLLLIDGTGLRCAWSANGKASAAPVLEVTYRRKPKTAPPPLACDVQLVFAEPLPEAKPGDRRFAVSVQGRQIDQLDLAARPGPRRTRIVNLDNVAVDEWLQVDLSKGGESRLPPILSGVRVRVRN